MNQANAILNKRKDDAKAETKPTTMAGQGIVTGGLGNQQSQLAYQEQNKKPGYK